VQNFGQVNLLESEYEFTSADGPIGGLMVQPVPIHHHDDGDDVFQVPFDLEEKMQGGQNYSNEEDWVEAEEEDDQSEYNTSSVGRKRARRAMELKSQQSHDTIPFGLGMNVDSSALAAVNMTLDSEGTERMGRGEEEEEEEWHAFDPEEEEEEEEEVMGHYDFDITMDSDRKGATNTRSSRRTKSSDISDIELVRGDDSRDQMSMVSVRCRSFLLTTFFIRHSLLLDNRVHCLNLLFVCVYMCGTATCCTDWKALCHWF
jgi:hypothetical protein